MIRSIVLFILIVCLVHSAQARTTTIAEELVIPIPSGWEVGLDTMQFPIKLTRGDSAEILVFRSVISPDEAITSKAGLKASVDEVIKEVVLSLPEAKLVSSTGFDRPPAIGFSIEFVSMDTLIFLEINHMLSAVVFRLEDDSQVMFTIWGKAVSDQLPTVRYAVNSIRDHLAYLGPHEKNAFAFSSSNLVLPGLMLIVSTGLLLLVRSRARRKSQQIADSPERFWRCLCGRLNGEDQVTCRRCGRSPEGGQKLDRSGIDESGSYRS